MSGHSKWHTIKHKKAAADSKRGRVFTKIIKELTVAARVGGGDPNGNPRLRTVLAAAKAANMPKDNIDKAIKKGTGELPGVSYDEVSYEGYGPGGVAVYVQALTDNKNRTLPEIRHLFAKYGGNLGEANCVGWMFEKKGYLVVPKLATSEDALMELVLEAGGDDVRDDGDNWEVFTPSDRLEQVREALSKRNVSVATAEISMVPKNTVKIEGKKAQQVLSMMDGLEEHDDVQNVWANFDIDAAEIGEERAAS
ncbi:MAG TPA: YebC/PmpR family DNA-binding transcriptional regulator [Candidatus Polarisedimenticolia bacterium]|jgi:YebC/PmpR family DNA-binding regulatory protein|nr:YebC/PmpR family DNA-binding transcriptional regulator [Candidatus Polarisedimenticolia bacterium]